MDEADGAVETNNTLYTESIAISMQVLESGSPLRVEAKLEIGRASFAHLLSRFLSNVRKKYTGLRHESEVSPRPLMKKKNIEGNKETLSPKTTTQRREITSPRL